MDQSDNVHLGGYPGPCGSSAASGQRRSTPRPRPAEFPPVPDGFTTPCSLLCDILHLEGAEALAHYGEDFYAGTPAVTRNHFAAAPSTMSGTQPDEAGLARVLGLLAETAGVRPLLPEETPLEVTRRVKDGKEYLFLLNFTQASQPVPASFAGETDCITGSPVPETLPPYGVLLIRR